MKELILNMVYLSFAFLTLFGLAELLFHKTKLKAEQTRKLVHFGTGLLTMLFPFYLASHWQVLVLCSSFLTILIASQKFDLLKSINGVDRKTYGSILFPVIVYTCFLVSVWQDDPLMYYLPIITLAISDPLAALFGKRFPKGKYVILGHQKTLVGSSAFFLSAFAIAMLVLNLTPIAHSLNNLSMALVFALVTSITEAVCKDGYDNLTIPVSAMIVLNIFKITNLC